MVGTVAPAPAECAEALVPFSENQKKACGESVMV